MKKERKSSSRKWLEYFIQLRLGMRRVRAATCSSGLHVSERAPWGCTMWDNVNLLTIDRFFHHLWHGDCPFNICDGNKPLSRTPLLQCWVIREKCIDLSGILFAACAQSQHSCQVFLKGLLWNLTGSLQIANTLLFFWYGNSGTWRCFGQ